MRLRLCLLGLLCCLAQAALAQADPQKVLRWVLPRAETGFDPARVHDYYSGSIVENIFERLVTYDYLARPAKLVPETAEALPEVADGGKTYTFRIKKGIRFAPDPVWQGRQRELTAADYAFSLKRFVDPKLRSPWKFLLEGKIVGLDVLAEQAAKTGKFDYDAKVAGLEVLDRHTLRIRLVETDYNFAHILAMPTFGAVAREVIDAYAEDTNAHPVGTGPYMLKKWVRTSKIFLEANPFYRGLNWDFKPGADPEEQKLAAAMQGKKMPQIGAVEVSVIEEDQSRWLAFQNGELDLLNMEGPLAPRALPGDQLSPELKKRGVRLNRIVDPEIMYTYWNMQDPVVGGMSKEKIALRRAMAMAYDVAEEIRVIHNGQAVAAQYLVPPGVVGHDAQFKSGIRHDPAAANALLDKFGYRKGADGWRRLPDGKPLTLRYSSRPDSQGRQFDELWAKSLEAIGIKLDIHKDKFPELLKAEKLCKLQMRTGAWIADYPDGDNFLQLLYGPNTGQSNNACARIPEFDELYKKSKSLPDTSERNRLYQQMMKSFEAHTPWRLGVSRYRNMLIQPRVLGYKKHPILHAEWLYMDLEKKNGR
ncbi:Heme-binding protein A [Burkholderiales bacterium]|nr:MAG: heme-binding protein [Burkholderiales bacterium]CAG0960598.1 Heme-binding protein A [Burkholderiales bacterium]